MFVSKMIGCYFGDDRKVNMILMLFAGFLSSLYFVIPGWYKILPVVLLFFAVFIRLFQSVRIELKLFFLCGMLVLLPTIGDLLNIYLGASSWSNVEKVLRNLILIYPLALAIAMRKDLSFFVFYSSVGILIITAFACFAQYFGFYASDSSHFNGMRVGLWWNPIPFSNSVILILSACFSTYYILYISKRTQGFLVHFTVVAAAFATMFIVVLSGSRGSLIGLVGLVLGFLIALGCAHGISQHLRWILALAMLCFVIIAGYFMGDRFVLAYEQFMSHVDSGPEPTSVSIRLTVWSFSLQAFLENPILGVGTNNTLDYKAGLISQGLYPSYLLDFHAHSDVFDAMARSGLVGLLGLVALYFSPFIIACWLKQNLANFTPLFFVTFSALLIGLTDTPLRNNISANAFFISYFLVLFVCIKNCIHNSVKTNI